MRLQCRHAIVSGSGISPQQNSVSQKSTRNGVQKMYKSKATRRRELIRNLKAAALVWAAVLIIAVGVAVSAAVGI
jgi:hypothetical protein